MTVRFSRATIRNTVVSALALTVALGGHAMAQASVSAAVGEPLQEAVQLIQSGDVRGGLAKADQAAAVSGKTQQDTLAIEQVRTAAYSRLRDYAGAARSIQAQIDAGATNGQELAKMRAQLLHQAGQKEQAAQAAQAYISQYGADTDLLILMASIANDAGDHATVVRHTKAAIAATRGTPNEQWLLLLLSASHQSGDTATATETLGQLARHYPKESYWRDYINMAQRTAGFNRSAYELDVYRVLDAAGVTLSAQERVGMAEVALIGGLPGEAVTTLEAANAAGQLDERTQRLLTQARERAASDRPSLAELEAESAAASSGQPLIAVGEAWLSYGDYTKAAELISAGLEKGGATNENAARLHLGIAQFKGGNASAARTTFGRVEGNDGAAALARIWAQIAAS